jgi:hypothetical protein
MERLALFTFGVLNAPARSLPRFQRLGAQIYRRIAGSPGFIGQATGDDPDKSHFEQRWGGWGEFAAPYWYQKGRTAADFAAAATLSLWVDVESAYAFTYGGLHGTALNRRDEWFEASAHPTVVMWWVGADERPCWADAVAKLEALDADGPQPQAFTFEHRFTPPSIRLDSGS